ncbi:MAG: ABC transporter ATP-binding protein, partial [Pseudomonadota bacterium]
RVALARALAPDPKLLLLDEPLGALDAKLRGQLQVELKDIQRRTGKTFVFVTHDQDEALTMSDRIIVMNEGRVEQDGTPETLYHRPESRFVAEFVGETNFIAAKVLSVDGEHVVVDMNGAHLSVAAPHGAPDVGRTVTAAIRPEKIVVRPFTASTRAVEHKAAGNILEAKVTARLFKGSRTLLTVAAGPGAATVLNAYDGGESASALGDKVVISWDQDAISILSD